jgi:sugar/nucleoside kinase (ribokinase family)
LKTMVNPSSKMSLTDVIGADILLVNREEAQKLIDSGLTGSDLVLAIKKKFPGILIMTDGPRKAYICDSEALYGIMPYETSSVDKTGAGDAFGAGFLAGWIKTKGNMVGSIQLAMANSIACTTKWGAKEGILKKGETFKKAAVDIQKLN